MDQVTTLLRTSRGLRPAEDNNFVLVRQEEFLNTFNRVTGVFFLVMIVLSSVGLMVGGVGVIAIMMIAVTERTREIGIRKAIGATKREILWQFLFEAVTVTCIGAIIGMMRVPAGLSRGGVHAHSGGGPVHRHSRGTGHGRHRRSGVRHVARVAGRAHGPGGSTPVRIGDDRSARSPRHHGASRRRGAAVRRRVAGHGRARRPHGMLDLSGGESGSWGTRIRPRARGDECRAHPRCGGTPHGGPARRRPQEYSRTRGRRGGAHTELRPRTCHPALARSAASGPSRGCRAGRDAASSPASATRRSTATPFRPHKLAFALTYAEHAPKPTFVADISDVMERKLEAIFAFGSQFEDRIAMGDVFGGDRPLRDQIRAYHAYYGSQIRRSYGEPYWTKETMRVEDLSTLDVGREQLLVQLRARPPAARVASSVCPCRRPAARAPGRDRPATSTARASTRSRAADAR
jgi:hypothetical protein